MPSKNKIILGIDPGLATTGYGIIIKRDGDFLVVNYGTIDTAPDEKFADRLEKIHNELNKIIKKYKPEILAIEDLFFFKNLKTAIKVAEARGVILMTGIENNLKIKEFTPLQIKQALTGYGRADKNQIQQMIKIILKLKDTPKPDDAADAIAIAICSANSNKY